MRKSLTGNNSFLKELNQKTILDLVRVNKAISKAGLSQLTGLSPTAVGVIVNKLLEKGYIHETGTGESQGGRKPVMLELKPRSFYTAGIDIDVGYM
ncbi:MAG: winged helix-turn-helix domain-containing protein, partial [Ruminiclostridium sp.]|nr:winged helix-turn-helix domain-containing protein [Ruminiclostridium sp.]